MPGVSFTGRPAAFGEAESQLQRALFGHVQALAVDIGVRHDTVQGSLDAAAACIAQAFQAIGFEPRLEAFLFRALTMHNVEAIIPGRNPSAPWLVFGAHYDTVKQTGGADDNASGVAALLELARLLKDSRPECTICFVAYANEEHNGGAFENMGSFAHARGLKESGVKVKAMIALEMLGYFDPAEGSQKYPFPFNLFYPTRGDFIGFVGNSRSASLVRFVVRAFRCRAQIASEGVAAPERFADIARSDHWSYWQHGWPALMVTDTSNFRNPHLHTAGDTPETLDYQSMTRVVLALERVARELASSGGDEFAFV
jgi:Zn-dependent M28 family amino/carboxypeptidase